MKKSAFSKFGLQDEILKAIELLNYKQPTNVQSVLIEAMMEKNDVVIQSQTGSGKTAAYAIPVIQMLDWEENKPQVLVLAPTRELAMQIKEDVFNIGRFKRVKVALLIGKTPYSVQVSELKQKTHVVVGTPGRILEHIEDGTLDLSGIRFLIIDEADEMLNLGFIPTMDQILKSVPKKRQTVLTSATIPPAIDKMIKSYSRDPQMIRIEDENKVSDRIEQYKMDVVATDKLRSLKEVITMENPDSCIIFANQKATVDDICWELTDLHYPVYKLHGGLEQVDRTAVINDFKRGAFRYLVATDVAARGLDIDGVSLIINYDPPLESEMYVHRIGRTGRFDKLGKAITFVNRNQGKYINNIENFIEQSLLVYEQPTTAMLNAAKPEFAYKKATLTPVKAKKGSALNAGIMQLQIRAGKQAKIRAVDIVGSLCGLSGMSAQDIGVIQIGVLFTDVEILNHKGAQVLDQLQTTPIKGKLRRVIKVQSK